MGENVSGWLERFGASDAQEEEVVDQGPAFRALLGEQKREPAPAEAAVPRQPRERRPRQPTR